MRSALSLAPADTLFLLPSSSGTTSSMDQARQELAATRRDELARLLSAVSDGDREAFARVYQRTSAKLYGICLRLLQNEAEAEDVLQEAYVTVWHKAERFDATKASPITWLSVLARNKALDRLRRRKAPTDDLAAAADIEDARPSAFVLVADAQETSKLHECLEELAGRSQAAIRAAFLDGLTYPELAKREQVPLGTMKSWIRRGLHQLRGCLDR